MNRQVNPTAAHRILLVEDDPSYARLVRAQLSKVAPTAELQWVDDLAAATSRCADAHVDVILLDLNLPDSEGIATIRRVYQAHPEIPIVVLTGTDDDGIAIDALKAGAQDYIRKDEIKPDSLGRSVRYAIERKAVERLEQDRHRLQDAVTALEHVIAVLGHELRTPLAGIRAMLEHLLEGSAAGSDDSEHFLALMHVEVLQLALTLNNLLEAARLDSGSARWNWGQVDLVPVIESAVETAQVHRTAADIPIHVAVETEHPTMQGDADAVRRLLVNLLTNAIKHTGHGRIDVIVRPATVAEHPAVRLIIRDTGCGMANNVIERLGTAFALNSGIVDASQSVGTGLGMAICKGIASAHGGHISVETAEGRGTTVTVELRTDLPGPVHPSTDTKIVIESVR